VNKGEFTQTLGEFGPFRVPYGTISAGECVESGAISIIFATIVSNISAPAHVPSGLLRREGRVRARGDAVSGTKAEKRAERV
jgi:hypothetical protein